MVITPLLLNFWYQLRLKLNAVFIVPSTLTSLLLIKLIACNNGEPIGAGSIKGCYELHLKLTFFLKRQAKKDGRDFDRFFLAEKIRQDVFKLKKTFGENIVLFGTTKLSVPGIIRKAKLSDEVTLFKTCRFSSKPKSRLFITTLRKNQK